MITGLYHSDATLHAHNVEVALENVENKRLMNVMLDSVQEHTFQYHGDRFWALNKVMSDAIDRCLEKVAGK